MELEVIDFDIVKLVEDALIMFAQSANEKGLELVAQFTPPDTSFMVRGDSFRLSQVIANLLNNAIKFTAQGEVVVRTKILDETETMANICICVEDTGIGIASGYHDKIFKHFSQADGSTTRQYGGTGLGLTICKRLLELMGGSIHVESLPGHGSKFWINLRLEKSELGQSATSQVANLHHVKILVVDDNQTNREILKLQLQSRYTNVVCTDSAEQALKCLAQAFNDEPFHLVILDMYMPEMNGLQLAGKIHADPNLTKTRMIMLTSAHNNASQLERQNIGIFRCVNKPIRQMELFEVINDVMGCDFDVPVTSPALKKQDSAWILPRPLYGKVLLAEDNPVNQNVAEAMLIKLGLEIEIAHNGKQAVDLVSKNNYDIILMDCQMPVMDGLEATALIRKQLKNNAQLPIIAITANASENDRINCLNAGMDDFLSKPYSVDQLRQIISRWLPKEKVGLMGTEPEIAEIEHPTNDTPVLNPERLDQIRSLDTSGEHKLVHKILRTFLESADGYVHQLQQAIVNGDADNLYRSAHTLKSSSANIGAESLSMIFKQLEGYGKAGEIVNAMLLQENLQQHYQQVIAEIREILDQSQ